MKVGFGNACLSQFCSYIGFLTSNQFEKYCRIFFNNFLLCFAGKCKHDQSNSTSNNSSSGARVCQSFPDQKTQGGFALSSRGHGGHYGRGRPRPPNLADIGRQQRLRGHLANLKFHAYYLEGGWGYLIVICAVLVTVINQGLQLSTSLMAAIADRSFHLRGPQYGVYTGGKTSLYRADS